MYTSVPKKEKRLRNWLFILFSTSPDAFYVRVLSTSLFHQDLDRNTLVGSDWNGFHSEPSESNVNVANFATKVLGKLLSTLNCQRNASGQKLD